MKEILKLNNVKKKRNAGLWGWRKEGEEEKKNCTFAVVIKKKFFFPWLTVRVAKKKH